MSRKRAIVLLAMFGVFLSGLTAKDAQAQSVADFYKGKIITVVVGFGPGGGYDRYSRLVARNLGRHLPGKPKGIVQFMTGGGSLRMANYLANVAPKNGTNIGMHSPVLPIFQLLRSKGFKVDVRNFNYIGRLATQNNVIMVRGDIKITRLDQVKTREVTVSSTGRASPTFIFPTILNSVVGTKFKVITGYAGSAAGRLAIERGEVMGLASGWISWNATSSDWIKSKYIVPLVEIALVRSPDLPSHVPIMPDLATNAEDRSLLKFIASATTIGRTLAGTPGIPRARVAALRTAFDAMVKSDRFLAGAKRRRVAIIPLSGVKVQKLVNDALSVSPKMVAKAKKALGYK